ncbi:lysozyme inhibitor LprI family protein [Ruegeria jejuensis]|uniref:lysozyme inhibitor LprI family protein n=1 Tax=Ruegeria jejuensis TaxID=3233338 RepID=UPI00355AD772
MTQRSMTRYAAIALFAAIPTAVPADGPSFDCLKAETPVETAICGDPVLSALDREMSTVYSAAMIDKSASDGDAGQALYDSQKTWLAQRDICAKTDAAAPDCLIKSYAAQLAAIAHNSETAYLGQHITSGPITFNCGAENGGFWYLAIRTEPEMMYLSRAGLGSVLTATELDAAGQWAIAFHDAETGRRFRYLDGGAASAYEDGKGAILTCQPTAARKN